MNSNVASTNDGGKIFNSLIIPNEHKSVSNYEEGNIIVLLYNMMVCRSLSETHQQKWMTNLFDMPV